MNYQNKAEVLDIDGSDYCTKSKLNINIDSCTPRSWRLLAGAILAIKSSPCRGSL
jgi:hypothetical protein